MFKQREKGVLPLLFSLFTVYVNTIDTEYTFTEKGGMLGGGTIFLPVEV
jgi:hypothetical protein